MAQFNCTQCGLCCTKVALALESKNTSQYKEFLEKFPYQADESGACEKFDKEKKQCSVYDTRPEICRVDKVYERFHKHEMSEEEYNKASEEACRSLQINALEL